MTDELVNVRYMVDDVEEAIDFYTTHFGFEVRSSFAPAFADVVRGNLTAAAEWTEELRGAADARRPQARARRVEPHPLHRRRHRV